MYRCVAAMVLFLFIFHITAVMISRLVFKCPFLPEHGPEEAAPEMGEDDDDADIDDERDLCDEADWR